MKKHLLARAYKTAVLCAGILVFAVSCSNSTSGNPKGILTSEPADSSKGVSTNTSTGNPTGPLYALGDTGPGGGIIFYVSEKGFTLYQSSGDTRGVTAHYLEAAPADRAVRWVSDAHYPPSFKGIGNWSDIAGTEDAIGTGRKNTALILAVDADAPAARACADANYGGKTDWFLPSRDELNELWKWKTAGSVQGFKNDLYWSSSQYSDEKAKVERFDDGKQTEFLKIGEYPVRAIRAF